MLKSIGRALAEEIRYVLSSRAGLLLLFVAPVLFIGSVCAIYWNKRILDVPVSIIDRDNSTLSREITQAIDANGSFKVVSYLQSTEEFKRQVERGESRACFVFPANFSRDLKRGKSAKSLVLLDASNTIIANIVSSNASIVLGSYSAGIDMRRITAHGKLPREAVPKAAMPIKDEYSFLYNPALNDNYANFMLGGMSVVVVQLITLLLAAGAVSSNRKIEQGALSAVIGKSAAYTLLTCSPAMLVVIIPIVFLNIPVVGSLWLLMGTICWFAAILSVLGVGVCALVGDTLQSTEYFAIVAMPSFLLSGYTWPDYAMPTYLAAIAHSIPYTAPALIVRKICLNGASADRLYPEFKTMLIWTAVAIAVLGLGALKLAGRNKASQEGAV